ncbi:hypothetical protein ACTJIJ_07495 [Niabella sp. 22666]|uniref:hypothetical protein n=1 Tax=Niabella sp. 22666 TaxID=3453954 RepID=UPI003F8320D9
MYTSGGVLNPAGPVLQPAVGVHWANRQVPNPGDAVRNRKNGVVQPRRTSKRPIGMYAEPRRVV